MCHPWRIEKQALKSLSRFMVLNQVTKQAQETSQAENLGNKYPNRNLLFPSSPSWVPHWPNPIGSQKAVE